MCQVTWGVKHKAASKSSLMQLEVKKMHLLAYELFIIMYVRHRSSVLLYR